MKIFESLENLEVSEACFDEIMGIVEEIINELDKSTLKSYIEKRDTGFTVSGEGNPSRLQGAFLP